MNPFDSLRKKREAEEAEAHREADRQHQVEKWEEEERSHAYASYVDLVKQYGSMIKRVLEQLRDARYPTMTLHTPYYQGKFLYSEGLYRQVIGPHWSLSWLEKSLKGGIWHAAVGVLISLDKDNQPVLICSAKSKTKECPLSEEELIKTLLELHDEP